MTAAPAGGDTETQSGNGRSHRWLWWTVGALAAVAIVAGAYVWSQYRTLTSTKYNVVAYTVPTAPKLVAAPGETVFRIDPTQSSLDYKIGEKLLGTSHTATGTTNGIAGDLALNPSNPSASRVGQIVVNVEELHSDNNLRDARMRSAYLESHSFPLAYLTASGVHGLPASLQEGTNYHFTIDSQLTVKQKPAAVTWTADGQYSGGKLTATATAPVKLSTFGIGPISVGGLVSTSNDLTLTMHLTALDPSKFTVPDHIAAPASAPRKASTVSFKRDVMPVLQANCVSCHKPGEVGAAHWTLTKASDAANISDGIGTVVANKYMPPWPASPVGVPLTHSRSLDQKTIDKIVDWANGGGKLDTSRDTKLPELPGPSAPPPRADVTLKMAEGYAGSLSVPNDYRCFILDPHFTQPTWITGFQVLPDQRPEIHHVQIFHLDASQGEAGIKRSGSDGKPGFSCYGSIDLPSTQRHRGDSARRYRGFTGQADLFAGWVPGQDPVTMAPGTGVLFQPGDVLGFQVHYHYNTQPVPDRSSVQLQTDPGDKQLKPIVIVNPVGPVEIPCNPDQSSAPLCDRTAAIADDERLYGPAGSFVENGLLVLCGKNPDEMAKQFVDGVAHSTCDYRIGESGTILSVFGHEHTLGQTFRMTLDPDKPDPTVLLDIPRWNFDWQMNYGLEKPIHVEAGQVIRMDCTWDRSLDPNRAPKYIVFAEGTEDEMCFSTFSLVPDNP